ncbi:MAG: DUF3089 domain-containing protein [Microthrixaceae bacterium]
MPCTTRPVQTLCSGLIALLFVALAAGCSSAQDSSAQDSSAQDSSAAPATLERYAGYKSEIYQDLDHWVCHPSKVDICDGNLDATVIQADGSTRVEPWAANPDAPIDCFYVYPTISRDPSTTSDLVASDEEEGYATLNQAARLGQECRVFAPVYRQRTLAGLVSNMSGTAQTSEDPQRGYKDVLDAWKQYMATDNQGRGVVLIGHSQGTFMMIDLMKEEIDPNQEVRGQLVAAYLAGGSLAVPSGADVGGDFANIPLCRQPEQVACAVSWSTFRSTSPPVSGSLFGAVRNPAAGEVAACNNPAALLGEPVALDSYFQAATGSSILSGNAGDATEAGSDATRWVNPAVEPITTPFVQTPGLVTGECVSRDGFSYLEATINSDPKTPRIDDIGGDLTPAWGLHLQDVNLVMGDIQRLVGKQAEAFKAAQ